jgi:hypothetical protein
LCFAGLLFERAYWPILPQGKINANQRAVDSAVGPEKSPFFRAPQTAREKIKKKNSFPLALKSHFIEKVPCWGDKSRF